MMKQPRVPCWGPCCLWAEMELLGCLSLWSHLDAQGEIGEGQIGHLPRPGSSWAGLSCRWGLPCGGAAEKGREPPRETWAEAAPGSPTPTAPWEAWTCRHHAGKLAVSFMCKLNPAKCVGGVD